VAYNFQTESNKIKLLMEYKSLTRKSSISIELILETAKQLQHALLSWHVSGLKITGHENPNNNLESYCT
jgi:hypothetical protein